MANSFNIDVKPEIAANLVQILSNASALGTIQITTLPDIATQNTNIKSVIDAISDPQLPNIAIQNTDIKSAVDAIQTDQYFSVLASDVEVGAADTERQSGEATYTEIKVIRITFSGIYRITFDLKTGTAAQNSFGRIYKDGVAFGTEQTNATVDYVNKSEDLYFAAGELCELYVKTASAPYQVYVQNFKVKGTGDVLKAYPVID